MTIRYLFVPIDDVLQLAPLRANISPKQVKAEEGESVIFNCSIKGHPVHSVTWVKNLNPVVANSRIRYLSRDLLQVAPIVREDKGMYQCFVTNDFGMAQGTAELSLGGKYTSLYTDFCLS
ncbi:hypothetical protein AVEN_212823-1 [Araneus ventricosus]|uniref:Ig-like domain-containing protein n=1 Tax=Araneus ventricosus TaxID=182803 RepID=A0A4Y2T787_ARAVE|nr:hypothetical protein AVEN_266624-1 [Araneus ventricosus]GBN95270.1 hypothetical protein AVEN_212823-1 [Araneus ventricosus]